MAIRQYHFTIAFSVDHEDAIRTFSPLTGNEWDCKAEGFSKPTRGQVARRDEIKNSIKEELEIKQGADCAFCGLDLKTRVPQIEHIAPKGAALHPQFMFEKKNLILACSLCNGFEKKHTFNTIVSLNPIYSNCTFNIIHPYFDNPNDHIEFLPDPNGMPCLIKVKQNGGVESPKGRQSVDLFELDTVPMTQERCKDALLALFNIPNYDDIIDSVKNNTYVSKS